MTIDEVIKQHTCIVLRKHSGKIQPAAKELGIGLKTLYNWLYKWKFTRLDFTMEATGEPSTSLPTADSTESPS